MSHKQQQVGMGERPIPAEQEVGMGERPVPASASSTPSSTPIAEDTTITEETQASGEKQPIEDAPRKKLKKRNTKWVSVEEVSPKPSYWPLALTVSICVLFMGIMIHPVVMGIGTLLMVISIMGWMLERR